MATLAERWREILAARELIKNLAARDLKVKYKGSALGFLWSLLHPAAFVAVYSFAFVVVLRVQGIKDFPLYFVVGYLPWICVLQSLMLGATSLVDHGGLIKKVSFPREAVPLALCASFFVTLCLNLLAVAPLLWLWGYGPGWRYGWLLPVFGLQLAGTVGACLWLSVLYARFRDVQYLLDLGATLLFWLTPIVYAAEMAPPAVAWALSLNPVTPLVGVYRWALLGLPLPSWWSLAWLCVACGGGFWLGARSFLRQSGRLIEYL